MKNRKRRSFLDSYPEETKSKDYVKIGYVNQSFLLYPVFVFIKQRQFASVTGPLKIFNNVYVIICDFMLFQG